MAIRVEVRNRFYDLLGYLPDEPVLVVGEYQNAPLYLRCASQEPVNDLAIRVNGKDWLRGEGDRFILKLKSGRTGRIRLQFYRKDQHLSTGWLFIMSQALTATQYEYLIRDLKELIRMVSASPTRIRGTTTEVEFQFIQSYQRRLASIQDYIYSFTIHLAQIEAAPHHTIVKKYHFERANKVQRLDATTIRWRATHPTSSSREALTYSYVQNLDVYENQFLIYTLKTLRHYLRDLSARYERDIRRKQIALQSRLKDWQHYHSIGGEKGAKERQEFKAQQMTAIRHLLQRLSEITKAELSAYQQQSDELRSKIDALLRQPFLAQVNLRATFRLSPTLVLLRHPAYHAIYGYYQQLQQELQLDEQQRIDKLLEDVPQERTSKLYEYWVFLQVYLHLKQMGFRDADHSLGIWELIDEKSFRLRSGASLELLGDQPAYLTPNGESIHVCLYYERRLGPDDNFRPDMFVEFTMGETKSLILDAKYRFYEEPNCPSYQEDIESTYHKYKRLEQKEDSTGDWQPVAEVDALREQICASFIIHSHHDETRYLDYGSSKGNANSHGAIPLVPELTTFNPTPLKRLLKMFMRMHLRLFDICWSEAHDEAVRAKRVRELGGKHRKAWEWEYHCESCNNRWWVNHCGNCGKKRHENITKITFSDPSDNFFEFDEHLKIGEHPLLKCSTCGEAYLGKKTALPKKGSFENAIGDKGALEDLEW